MPRATQQIWLAETTVVIVCADVYRQDQVTKQTLKTMHLLVKKKGGEGMGVLKRSEV